MSNLSQLVLAVRAHMLIMRCENRYNVDSETFYMRQRLRVPMQLQVEAAAAKHFSECCRSWGEITSGKHERFYDGVTYRTVESELDDWQCEGQASLEAMAVCGLPIWKE